MMLSGGEHACTAVLAALVFSWTMAWMGPLHGWHAPVCARPWLSCNRFPWISGVVASSCWAKNQCIVRTVSGRTGVWFAALVVVCMEACGPALDCRARVLARGARSMPKKAGPCSDKGGCPLVPLRGHLTKVTGTAPKALLPCTVSMCSRSRCRPRRPSAFLLPC